MRWYGVLLGHIGRRFLKILMAELNGVRTRYWNYECPLVFAAIILPTTDNVQY